MSMFLPNVYVSRGGGENKINHKNKGMETPVTPQPFISQPIEPSGMNLQSFLYKDNLNPA
jgi:hypothetical protein